jgi:hypothetical protein
MQLDDVGELNSASVLGLTTTLSSPKFASGPTRGGGYGAICAMA